MAIVNFTLEEARLSSIPVGTIIDYYGSSQPDGWLICDGRAVPDSMPKLKALIGAKTPDLRGRFRRMIGGNAAGMGVAQGDAIRNITGTFYASNENTHYFNPTGAFTFENIGGDGVDGSNGAFYKVTFNASNVVPVDDENRPINMAFNTLIYGGGFLVLYLKQLLGGVIKYGNY